MNKMDNYYKKQLTNYKEAEDGWNIPSEDMWSKAKPHFPKPKKKRRILFLLMSLGLLLLVSTLYITTRTTTEPLANTNNTTESPYELSNTQISDSEIDFHSSNSSTNSSSDIADAKSIPKTGNETKKASITNNPSTDNASDRNIKISEKNIITSTPTTITNHKNTYSLESNFSKEARVITVTNNIIDSKINTNQNVSTNSNSSTSLNTTSKNTSAIPTNNLITRNQFTFPLVQSLAINSLALNDDEIGKNRFDKILKATVISIPVPSRHEFGLGSTVHLLSLIGEQKNDPNTEWPEEELFFSSFNNVNVNLHYNFYLTKNWSLSSGFYYSKMNFNINGCAFEEAEQADIDQFLKFNLGDQLNKNLAENRQENEVQIELLEGETVNAGDTLKIGLDVDLSLRSIQIPLIINRKWDIKRTELFLGIGGTVDFQYWKQESAFIEFFKDNRLISKPYREGPGNPQDNTDQKTESLEVNSLIIQTGINYKINQHLKFGLTARAVAPEFITSGIEARILYRL